MHPILTMREDCGGHKIVYCGCLTLNHFCLLPNVVFISRFDCICISLVYHLSCPEKAGPYLFLVYSYCHVPRQVFYKLSDLAATFATLRATALGSWGNLWGGLIGEPTPLVRHNID